MKLKEWLAREEMPIKKLAEQLKVDRSYIHRWITGDRVPSQELMDMLIELTNGKVKNFKDLKRKSGKKDDN